MSFLLFFAIRIKNSRFQECESRNRENVFLVSLVSYVLPRLNWLTVAITQPSVAPVLYPYRRSQELEKEALR